MVTFSLNKLRYFNYEYNNIMCIHVCVWGDVNHQLGCSNEELSHIF